MCKQTQHVTSKQCSELLANNVTSVCTGLYVKPVAVSYFQIQNGLYCKFTISWNLNWLASAKSGGERGKIPLPFSPLSYPFRRLPRRLKPCENGRNIVGHHLPTLLDVICCVRLHTLLHVVPCCWKLLCKVWNQSNFQLHANGRNNSQHCRPNSCVPLHVT